MNMTTVPSNQLKAMQHEIADLKEQVALYAGIDDEKACIAHLLDRANETIAQQAEAIEKLRDHIELSLEFCDEEGFCVRDNLENALAIQPSPEILQARDERVAEACAKIVNPSSLTYITRGDALTAIRSGEWRKYL